MTVIPDVPNAVAIQTSRSEFLVSKVIDKVSDDEAGFGNVKAAALEIFEYPDRELHSVGRNSTFLPVIKVQQLKDVISPVFSGLGTNSNATPNSSGIV